MKMNSQKAHLWAQNYTTAASELSSIFLEKSCEDFVLLNPKRQKSCCARLDVPLYFSCNARNQPKGVRNAQE